MSKTSPLGSRSDDPLLKNDPLAPEAEPDASDPSTEEAPAAEPRAAEPKAKASGYDDSVFSASSSSGNGTKDGASASSLDDLLAYLVENRAAIDVLFEMLAFDRADGEEQDYRHFLKAMRERHEQATQTYREALDIDLPDTSQGSPSLDDGPMS